MYIVDVNKIKGKIVEKGFSQYSFAAALGISRETLRTYLKDYKKLPYEIIVKIIDVLEMSLEEARKIFFTLKLS